MQYVECGYEALYEYSMLR